MQGGCCDNSGMQGGCCNHSDMHGNGNTQCVGGLCRENRNPRVCCNSREIQRKHSSISKCSRGININEKISYRHLHPRQSYGINFAKIHDNFECYKPTADEDKSRYLMQVPLCDQPMQMQQQLMQMHQSMMQMQQPIMQMQQPMMQMHQPMMQMQGMQQACLPQQCQQSQQVDSTQQCQSGMRYFEIQQPTPPPIIKCFEEKQPCSPPIIQCFEPQCSQPQTTPMRLESQPPCPQSTIIQQSQQVSCQQTLMGNLHQQHGPSVGNLNCDLQPTSQANSNCFRDQHASSTCLQVCDPTADVLCIGNRGKSRCDCAKMERKIAKQAHKKTRELIITKSKAHSINFAEMYNAQGCQHDDECASRKSHC